jgi:hypothetical protein
MNEQEPENTAPAQDGRRPVTSREEVGLGLTLGERLHAIKVKGVGETGRPPFERDSRDEPDRDTGRMTWREQVYDRENDSWEEIVTFRDTGELKFRRAGRLSEKEAIIKAFNHYRALIARLAPQPQ